MQVHVKLQYQYHSKEDIIQYNKNHINLLYNLDLLHLLLIVIHLIYHLLLVFSGILLHECILDNLLNLFVNLILCIDLCMLCLKIFDLKIHFLNFDLVCFENILLNRLLKILSRLLFYFVFVY